MYVWLGTMIGLLFAGMYIAVNVACIGYYLREGRSEFNVLKHIVVPVLGVIAMIPAVLARHRRRDDPDPRSSSCPPYDELAAATRHRSSGSGSCSGIVAYFVLRSRNPEALARVDDIYSGDTVATPEGRTSV